MNKIKQHFKKTFGRTDFSGLSLLGRGQYFDWKMLLSLFLILMICIVAFSIYFFLEVRAGDIFTGDYKTPAHTGTINRNVLDRIIEDFGARADNLKSLQTQKPVFVDPSL